MVLYAAKNSTYREVIEVLDLMRQVGGDRVALATVPTEVEPNNSLPSLPEIPGVSNPYKIPAPPEPPK